MANPQQPEPDRARGPVPADNEPGHHPAVEQDKPEAARFVAKVKEVAAEAEPEPEPEVAIAEPAPAPAPAPPASSPRAEGLATLAGAPWKLASDVLQRLRDRL